MKKPFSLCSFAQKDRNSGGLERLAYALASQGHYNEAIDLLKECQQKNPKNMEVLRSMIPCYIGIRRPDEARNILLDLLANASSENKDNYLLGKLFYEMGDRESAQKYFTDFLLNLDASQAGEGQDALVLVMSAYYHNAGSLSCRNAMYGLVFFKMCLLMSISILPKNKRFNGS